MAKSLLSSLTRSFGAKTEEEKLPTPDLARVLKPTKAKSSVPVKPAPTPVEETPESNQDKEESWLTQDVAALTDALSAFVDEPNEPARRRALFLCAHNLRGAAEPLGNPHVARIAGSLCRLIEASGSGQRDLNLAELHVRAIGAAANGEEGSEVSSSVCVALEDSVRNRSSSAAG